MSLFNSFKEKYDEAICYWRFVELQNAKREGKEVRETPKEMAYRKYLTKLIEIDKPKKNPIGFC